MNTYAEKVKDFKKQVEKEFIADAIKYGYPEGVTVSDEFGRIQFTPFEEHESIAVEAVAPSRVELEYNDDVLTSYAVCVDVWDWNISQVSRDEMETIMQETEIPYILIEKDGPVTVKQQYACAAFNAVLDYARKNKQKFLD